MHHYVELSELTQSVIGQCDLEDRVSQNIGILESMESSGGDILSALKNMGISTMAATSLSADLAIDRFKNALDNESKTTQRTIPQIKTRLLAIQEQEQQTFTRLYGELQQKTGSLKTTVNDRMFISLIAEIMQDRVHWDLLNKEVSRLRNLVDLTGRQYFKQIVAHLDKDAISSQTSLVMMRLHSVLPVGEKFIDRLKLALYRDVDDLPFLGFSRNTKVNTPSNIVVDYADYNLTDIKEIGENLQVTLDTLIHGIDYQWLSSHRGYSNNLVRYYMTLIMTTTKAIYSVNRVLASLLK